MYVDVIARIYDAARVVAGIQASSEYEPTAIGEAPHLYTMLVGMSRKRLATRMRGETRGPVEITYRTRIRILAPYEENASADTVLWGFVNTVTAAVEAAHLDFVVEATAGKVDIGGRSFRGVELTVESVETMQIGTG